MFVVVMTLARNHEMTFLIVIIDSVEDKIGILFRTII